MPEHKGALSIQSVKSYRKKARAFELRGQGWTHRQIAAELGCSESHAARMVRLAIQAEVSVPARELGMKLVEALSDEALALKGTLERVRLQLNARGFEKPSVYLGLLAGLSRGTDSLERLIARIAQIAGAEAPRQVNVAVAQVDPEVIRRALIASIVDESPEIQARVMGRFRAALGGAAEAPILLPSDVRSDDPDKETLDVPDEKDARSIVRYPDVTQRGDP
jgi:hypothetical protein